MNLLTETCISETSLGMWAWTQQRTLFSFWFCLCDRTLLLPSSDYESYWTVSVLRQLYAVTVCHQPMKLLLLGIAIF